MKIKGCLKKISGITISFPIFPLFRYEISFDDLMSSKTIDARIARLRDIKRDLEAAISAVQDLQYEADERRTEAEKLKEIIDKLQEDRNAAESLLKVPEESFMRLLGKANSKGHIRGLFEGIVTGFITGVISSLLVWFLTR